MVASEKLFNPIKRKLLRKRMPLSETVSGAAVVILLALLAFLILAQQDNYDPADRDISPEQLQGGVTASELYKSPMKRWSEPGGESGSARPPDLGILPVAILDGGWTLDGRLERYDPSTLYEKIDGAAELYLAFGFERLDYLTLTKDEHSVTLELYDQGRFSNSLGLFSGQRRPDHVVETRGALDYYMTPIGAVGRFGEYYFKIAGNSEAAPVLAKAEELLASFELLPAESLIPPAPYALLTQELNVSPELIEYRRDNVFQYEFANDFWFGPVADAGDARYFVHESVDAGAAAALYGKLLAEQKWEYAVVEEGERRAVLEHEYLNTFFAISRLENLLVGIEKAPSGEVVRRQLDRLEGAVRNGG
jgi:hypothetical protein